MKTKTIAAIVLLTALRLIAQSDNDHPGEYGYRFVPKDASSDYGGELWFGQPQFPTLSNPSDGVVFDFDSVSSFLLTPEQAINMNAGNLFSPEVPILPQTPVPYTGKLSAINYLSELGALGVTTWNEDGITSMNIAGWGDIDYRSTSSMSSFVNTNIFGVLETYAWTISATNVSWQISLSPETYSYEAGSVPSYSGSENGTWVAIPDCTNSLPLLGLTVIALVAAWRLPHLS